MGEVWLARDRALGRDVALKAMRPSDSATRTRRFEREARALAALDHPSILPVLHAGEDPATGLRYLVTPAVLLSPSEIARLCDEVLLCPYPRGYATAAEGGSPAGGAGERSETEGVVHADSAETSLVTRHPSLVTAAASRPLPLAALLDGGKTLPEAAVLRIARDLAGALAAAHAVGILHRDVKPSNVLFDASGRALLADFGLAKFTRGGGGSHAESAESAESPDGRAPASPDGRAPSRPERGSGAAEAPDSISLDESGARKFLGSPAYAAPEQFRAGAELTPALDWYSFGAVLYEALTGDRPRSLRPPSSYDPSRIVRAWDPFLRDLLDPDPARRLADPAAITRRLDAIGRAIDPATRSRRRAARAALAAVAALAAAVAALRFHAGPGPGVETHAESAEPAEIGSPAGGAGERSETEGVVHAESAASIPLFGGGAGEAKPPPVALVFPAHPAPPRLDSVWQGEDRGPLQLLGTFRLLPIVRFEAEAFSGGDSEFLLKVREGDGAWASWTQDRAAIGRANSAWFEAVETARRAAAATNAAPAARVRLALCLARLAWTYVANADQGAADAPYRAALAAIDPLVESDAARYGPLRSWLLSERAYAEGMEGRFRESAADLQEAGLLWAHHAPADDPGCEAQRFVLAAALGGMLHRAGDTAAALTMTSRAIEALEPFLFPANPARGSGDNVPRSLADLLAGCHYRLGELHRETGAHLESIVAYRRATELWRDLFKAHGEGYRLACAQALGRLARTCAEQERYEEAVSAWDEMRGLLAPLLVSDPARYRPVIAEILDNLVRAHRALGDEERARALEAEAAALAQP